MATLATIRTKLAAALRDPANDTFTSGELDDLINQGIDEVGSIRPREIVTTVGTVSSGVYTYALTGLTNIYRLDIYRDGEFRATLPHGIGEGPTSGWENHASVLRLPPNLVLTAGDTLVAFGYGAYAQMEADSQTADFDATVENAVLVFAQVEAFQRLVVDRAKFQQWVSDSNNTDVTALGMAQLAAGAAGRWDRQRQRIRRPRKLG